MQSYDITFDADECQRRRSYKHRKQLKILSRRTDPMGKGPVASDDVCVGKRNGHDRNGDIRHGQIVEILSNGFRRFGAEELHNNDDEVAEDGDKRCEGVKNENE